MTEEIIIHNPSEDVKRFFDAMRKRKERKVEELSKMEAGIFTIKV